MVIDGQPSHGHIILYTRSHKCTAKDVEQCNRFSEQFLNQFFTVTVAESHIATSSQKQLFADLESKLTARQQDKPTNTANHTTSTTIPPKVIHNSAPISAHTSIHLYRRHTTTSALPPPTTLPTPPSATLTTTLCNDNASNDLNVLQQRHQSHRPHHQRSLTISTLPVDLFPDRIHPQRLQIFSPTPSALTSNLVQNAATDSDADTELPPREYLDTLPLAAFHPLAVWTHQPATPRSRPFSALYDIICKEKQSINNTNGQPNVAMGSTPLKNDAGPSGRSSAVRRRTPNVGGRSESSSSGSERDGELLKRTPSADAMPRLQTSYDQW